METDEAELARVAENEAVAALTQNQVIVFEGRRGSGFEAQLSAHAQMNAQPAALGESEEHLFAVCFGTEQC